MCSLRPGEQETAQFPLDPILCCGARLANRSPRAAVTPGFVMARMLNIHL